MPAVPLPVLDVTAAVLDDAGALAVVTDDDDVVELGVVDVGVDVVLVSVEVLLEAAALGTLAWLSAAFGVSVPHAASAPTAVRTAAVRSMLVFDDVVFIVFPLVTCAVLSVTLGGQRRRLNRRDS